jgi:hypothetical protein
MIAAARGAVHGILVLDKPAGMTSATAVDHVRRALGISRAGHGGTLDPIATGVLPICLGAGTKLAQFLLAEDKAYLAEGVLGIETDTLDRTGRVVAERAGDQAGRGPALRSRAGRRGGRARAAPDPDRSPGAAGVRAAAVPDRDRVQQGHVRPQPDRRSRHRGGGRRPPGRAPPDAQRPVLHRAGGDPGSAG